MMKAVLRAAESVVTLKIPNLSLVLLIGASGAGKSTFAKKHFKATEIISSDRCRGWISDDETNQAVTKDAFDLVHFMAQKRLKIGRLTVIDATNTKAEDRKTLLELARNYHFFPVAIAFDLPSQICHDRNQQRPDRNFGPEVVERHTENIQRSLPHLKREGFRYVFILSSVEEIDKTTVKRRPSWNDRRRECGPFDMIGDIRGCGDELAALLQKLGYEVSEPIDENSFWSSPVYRHPQGRKAIFLGNLVDGGPRPIDTLKLVRAMVKTGTALCVPGERDIKLMRKLWGRKVPVQQGLEKSLAAIEALPEAIREPFAKEIADFLHSLVHHYVLDGGKLVVAHAGMKESMQGRNSKQVRDFAVYGETTGETDAFDLSVRPSWVEDYRGRAMVVYSHPPISEPEWLNNTINLNTGCAFGGKLTALRYPEQELVSVPARQTYSEPAKLLFVSR
jgi:protein phosphatase